jgi:RHS repeat-associated protein
VLDDGSNAYLYGLTRIGEEQPAGWALHIPDALGSVRQLTDANGGVALAKGYQPFGSVMASIGAGETIYSFTGEWADGTGLLNLRARYYDSQIGRFIRRDDFVGGDHSLLAPNLYLYVMNNPINWIDSSGYYRWWATTWEHRVIEEHLARKYGGPGDAWKMHLEYPIGGSRYYGGIVDLIYFSDAYDMKSSFYPISNLGYVYEIKPHYGQMSIINAKVQLQGYLNALSLHSSRLAHSSDPEGIGYDWRGLSWEAGILPIPPRTEIILLTGGEQLIVWFEGDGAIMYAKSNWSRVQPEAFKELPSIIAYDWLKWLKDQGREADYKDQIENLDWEGDLATENAIGSPFPLPDIVEDIAKATGISIGWIVGCYAVYKLGSIFTLGPGSFALP